MKKEKFYVICSIISIAISVSAIALTHYQAVKIDRQMDIYIEAQRAPIVYKAPHPRYTPSEQLDSSYSPGFHVKINLWFKNQWQVVYTKNGFLTQDTIMQCFDISGPFLSVSSVDNVAYMPLVFKSSDSAKAFASRFTDYKLCLKWGDSIRLNYKKMLRYRLHNSDPVLTQKDIIIH